MVLVFFSGQEWVVLAGDGMWMVGGFGRGLEWCRIWRKGGENKHIFKNNWVDFFLIFLYCSSFCKKPYFFGPQMFGFKKTLNPRKIS